MKEIIKIRMVEMSSVLTGCSEAYKNIKWLYTRAIGDMGLGVDVYWTYKEWS